MTPLRVTPASPLVQARLAVTFAFFDLGVAGGLWAVHIPLIDARLHLGEVVIGLALLAIALGAVVAMPLTGWAVGRVGSKSVTGTASVILPVVTAITILAPSTAFLFVSAFVLGLAM